MLPKVFLLLDKDIMLLFGSIRLVRCHVWNCVTHNFYASSHSVKHFLPCTCTHIYFQEQGRTFVHTMSFLVVQHRNQNVQICIQNIMLKKIIVTVGVNVPLHIPNIQSLTNSSTTSTSFNLLQTVLQLQHLTCHIHLHMSTFIGICYLKRMERTNWFHTRNI